ncbi:nuclear factor 7, ovary-like isoform X1 [Protopterus annectens]|uniref:nuclear factor 7, ovary-like isoform X1 n=1 Tax=Protopterus annectens TaxID=7888 RepID=UPI001CFC02DD|nr:nuclear factor 7, ovary-like isoform X1 [Protopterus annectens]
MAFTKEPQIVLLQTRVCPENAGSLSISATHDTGCQEDLQCPVCAELFEDPVVVECGHSFCRACIESFWNKEKEQHCPKCQEGTTKLYFISRSLAALALKAKNSSLEYPSKKDKIQVTLGKVEKLQLQEISSAQWLEDDRCKSTAFSLDNGLSEPQLSEPNSPNGRPHLLSDGNSKAFTRLKKLKDKALTPILKNNVRAASYDGDAAAHLGKVESPRLHSPKRRYIWENEASVTPEVAVLQEAVHKEKLDNAETILNSRLKELMELKNKQMKKLKEVKGMVESVQELLISQFTTLHLFLWDKEKGLLQKLGDQEQEGVTEMEDNLRNITEEENFIQEMLTKICSRLSQKNCIAFLTETQSLVDRFSEYQQTASETKLVTSYDLNLEMYSGPLMYNIWKEMKSIVTLGNENAEQ